MSTHTHYYFMNLLVSDLVQAIGEHGCNKISLTGFKTFARWNHECQMGCRRSKLLTLLTEFAVHIFSQEVTEGAVCTTQGSVLVSCIPSVLTFRVTGIFKQMGDVGVALS
jgi:hypothetical protein